MLGDVKCPYCGAEQEINHDDGYGYDECVTYNQECPKCEKSFVYTTTIILHYRVEKADCLNGSEHVFRHLQTWPVEHTLMECSTCGERRQPTEDEWKSIRLKRVC